MVRTLLTASLSQETPSDSKDVFPEEATVFT